MENKERINKVLGLNTANLNKLILIYLILEGNQSIRQDLLAEKLWNSSSGVLKGIKELVKQGYLEVDKKTYRCNYYKVLI